VGPMCIDADVSEITTWHFQVLARKVIDSLEKNNIKAEYSIDRKQALAKVIEAIPQNASIGIGDSVTLHQIGFFDWLDEQDRQVFNPFLRGSDGRLIYTPSEHFEMLRKALISDVYLASSNAVTLDGKLVSIDGRGNRVAAMLWGPKKVILVMGVNKIVRDIEEAMGRLKIAAVMNGKRHLEKHGVDRKYPCVVTGICTNCRGPIKMCRKTVIIDGQRLEVMAPDESGISVILVGESLGF
jgi:hypothetical protein